MRDFSTALNQHWLAPFLAGERLAEQGPFTLHCNPDLPDGRRAMLLDTADGRSYAVIAPTVAERIRDIRHIDSAGALRQALAAAGLTLNGADCVYHYRLADHATLQQEADAAAVRRLGPADAALFAAFQAAAPEQDFDDAYVELDHWRVFGAIVNGQLVCAASMYPWSEQAAVADMGVLTLPAHRGQGHARRVIRAISRHALALGYEPQYRCQLDNAASRAVAQAAGLQPFGEWDVVVSED